MDINRVSMGALLSGLSGVPASDNQVGALSTESSTRATSNVSLSAKARMMSAPPRLSDEDKAALDAFRDTVNAAKEDGSFDAEALAEEAPAALQTFADAMGVDLATLIENTHTTVANQEGGHGPHGPGGMGNGHPPEIESNLTDFAAMVEEAVTSGEYDVDTLAEEAPEGLQQMAKDMGVDVAELVQDMASRIENGDTAMGPPPTSRGGREMMAAYQSAASADNNELSNLLLSTTGW